VLLYSKTAGYITAKDHDILRYRFHIRIGGFGEFGEFITRLR